MRNKSNDRGLPFYSPLVGKNEKNFLIYGKKKIKTKV